MRRVLRIPQARFPAPDHRFRRPFAISLLLHIGLVALLVWMQQSTAELGADEATALPGGGGGGGGRRVTFVVLPSMASASRQAPVEEEVTERERPVPIFTPHVREIVPIAQPVSVRISRPPLTMAKALGAGDGFSGGAGSGSGSGGGRGSGKGTGIGSGEGPGSGGTRGDVLPPSVRFSALPPMEDRPSSLRGRSFRVLFTVDRQGRVMDVRTEPEIDEAGYRRKFLNAMRRYRFNPATQHDGTAVVGLATVTVTL